MPPTSVSHSVQNVCDTPACHDVSREILSMVNMNVDPCSDFFQYTCGSWLESKPVKESFKATRYPKQVANRNRYKVMEILSGTFEQLEQDIQTDDKTFQLDTQAEIDRSNHKRIQDYYHSCIDVDARSKVGASVMFPIINEIQASVFPITESIDPDTVGRALAQHLLLDVKIFFESTLFENYFNLGTNLAMLSPLVRDEKSDYSPGSNEYYLALVNNITNVVGTPSSDNIAYEKFMNEQSQAYNFTFWSGEKIGKVAIDYINIERLMTPIISGNYSQLDKPSKMNDLIANSTNINWDIFFSTLVSEQYVKTNPDILFHENHIRAIDDLISTLSVEVLQEYFIVKTILQKLDSLKFPEPDSFIPPVIRDYPNATPEEECATETSKKFKDIVSRFFVLKTLGGSDEKKNVEDMADLLHSTWIEDASQTSWLDYKSKERLLEKIKVMKRMIAYTSSPDLKDASKLAEIYNDIETDKNYFETTSDLILKQNRVFWQRLENLIDRELIFDSYYPDMVNAFFMPLRNTINIPIGIIQKPFYGTDYPQYVNYGSLGSIIGHEYMHSIDVSSIRLNSTGQEEEWLTKFSREAFEEKAQCMADQYSKQSLLGESNRRLYINGYLTLGENMADSGGITLAFNAYQKYVQENGPDMILPGFENLTANQLFFIAHGLFNCETGQKSENEGSMKADPHSPLYQRAIIPYQNSNEFSEAFNCPVGSPMNPKDKCSVW